MTGQKNVLKQLKNQNKYCANVSQLLKANITNITNIVNDIINILKQYIKNSPSDLPNPIFLIVHNTRPQTIFILHLDIV